MSREKGTFGVIDNSVIEFAKRNRNAAGSVLLVLAERANYSRKAKAVTVPEIMMETGLKERAVEMACAKLQAQGYVNVCANGYAYGDTQEAAELQAVNAAQDALPESLKELEGCLEGSKDVKAVLVGTEYRATQPGSKPELANRQADADSSSLEKNVAAILNAAPDGRTDSPSPVAAPPSPAAYRAEHHGDDHDAVTFFLGLAGGNFVRTYRLELDRWASLYSADFLRLAYRLAPTIPGARGFYVFADVLNQDPRRPWPEALTRAYRTEQRADASEATAPRMGDVLICGDARGRVIGVDAEQRLVDIQTGQDHTEYVTVPWASTHAAVSIGRTA